MLPLRRVSSFAFTSFAFFIFDSSTGFQSFSNFETHSFLGFLKKIFISSQRSGLWVEWWKSHMESGRPTAGQILIN